MDYEMKSMKVVPAEKPLSTEEALRQGSEQYPYGLRIQLTSEVLKKLQLSEIPEVGEMMGLHAIVEVVGVNYDGVAAGSKQLRVELQITDMCLKEKGEDHVNKVAEQEDKEEYSEKTLLGSGE